MSPAWPPAVAVACAAVGITSFVAVAVVLTGSQAATRQNLELAFPGPSRQAGDAAEIAAQNGRYALAVVLACAAVKAAPAVRPLLDFILAGLLGLNASLIGLAWGAYSTQLLRYLALHGTVELAAFSLCGGTYLRARREPLAPAELACPAACAALLLCLAAWLETYTPLEDVV